MKNNKFYHIYTYGCQMNIHESEKLAGFLEERGYIETKEPNLADVIVFNTCCIRKSAEEKIFGNIGAIKPIKKKNPNLVVAVCGCMAQQSQMAETIQNKFPFVDIIFGTHNVNKFGQYLDDFNCKHEKLKNIEEEIQIIEGTPVYRTSGYNAWVNIMYGCNNFCTYCIVPYVRGREISRKPQDIINEIENLLKTKKYKIITLLGQNVNSYGKDLEDNINFAKLMQKIVELPYEFKLKFMTSHPKDLTDEVIETIANNDKISKAIHLPVQSGSNRILKLMNRKYTVEHYKEIIKKIKDKIPNATITSDFIVGFPTETEEDFLATCELIKDVEYNSIFAFMYSKREGTPAAIMEGQISDEIKNQRVNTLLKLEKEISNQKNYELIGKIENCIVEKKLENDDEYLVKTDGGKTIIVKDDNLNLLEFVDVKITKISKNQLYGEIVNNGGTNEETITNDATISQ